MTDTQPPADVVPDSVPGPLDGLRELTDARTMRALSHPVRIALIEALSLHGAMTATEAGERIAESPTTCSFHLRQLAKYGLVEEAGRTTGRARPWRMASIGLRMKSDHDDPATAMAAEVLTRLFRERQLDRYRTWLETRSSFPAAWCEVVGDGEFVFYLTVDELRALTDELLAILVPRFRERLTDPSRRPAGAVPVEMLLFTYPIAMPDATR